MRFLAAFDFLTVIHLPRRREANPGEVGGSIAYFPVVGFIIGLILAGLNWLLIQILPSSIVNALLIITLIIISGAMHIDGFIDTCDGLAGHKTIEDRLRIMHDSRVGAFGVVGAVLLLLLQYVSLRSIPRALMPAALILMPVMSRWAMVFAIFAYSYTRPEGLGKLFKQEARAPGFALATLFTLIITLLVTWFTRINYFYAVGLVIMFMVWLVTVGLTTYLNSKLAGLTGDSYGAINEAAEVSVLILMVVLAYQRWRLL